jgi:hypothetical protein
MQIFRTENPAFGEDWALNRERIMKVPIRGVFADLKNSTSLMGLNPEQMRNFALFMEEAKQATGNKDLIREVVRANPGATAEDFLKKVAPLVNQGQRLGLYTTTK